MVTPFRPGVLVVLVAVAVQGGAALAGEGSVELHTDVVSRYVFRGVLVDDSWSFQPRVVLGVDLGRATWVEAEAWFNAALETQGSATHQDEVFEMDLTLSVGRSLSETVALWVGGVHYRLPFSDLGGESEVWSTTEVAAGLEWSPEPVVVGASLWYDLDRYKGFYLDLNAEAELALGGAWAVAPRLHLGLARDLRFDPTDPDREFVYQDDGLVEGDVALGLVWAPTETLSFHLTGHYTYRLDDPLEDDRFAWVAVGLSFTP